MGSVVIKIWGTIEDLGDKSRVTHRVIVLAQGMEVRGYGEAAVWCWSNCEETPHIQRQRRSSSKTAGQEKSHLESNRIPTRDAQRPQTNLVCTRTQRPHRD